MKKIFLLIVIFTLVACQATKDALTLKKKNNSDEFLVEKKNPLVLPPDFGELPVPEDIKVKNKKQNSSEKTISLDKESLISKKDKNLSSIEKSILKKIKKK